MDNPVYVIGAGPNGVPFYDRIPAGVSAYALNGAATNHIWTGRIFGDVNCYRYDYYYRRNPGELRIGPLSCGSDFDLYIPEKIWSLARRWLELRSGGYTAVSVANLLYCVV